MYYDQDLSIRPVEKRDLLRLWELVYKEDKPEWKKWDAPYFPHNSISYEQFMKETAESWIGKEGFWTVVVDDVVRGIVSYYFEDDQHKWLEIGIVLHESGSWNKGIGTRALKLGLPHVFKTIPVQRVGLTTWSGNERMMRVGEKIGMQLEGRIRKVRFYNETYYDSIRMGILREEFETSPLYDHS